MAAAASGAEEPHTPASFTARPAARVLAARRSSRLLRTFSNNSDTFLPGAQHHTAARPDKGVGPRRKCCLSNLLSSSQRGPVCDTLRPDYVIFAKKVSLLQ
jgi:hypothetical protein